MALQNWKAMLQTADQPAALRDKHMNNEQQLFLFEQDVIKMMLYFIIFQYLQWWNSTLKAAVSVLPKRLIRKIFHLHAEFAEPSWPDRRARSFLISSWYSRSRASFGSSLIRGLFWMLLARLA